MSQEGRNKKRKAEISESVFWSMPSLVHHCVSPYLLSWKDHRSLACSTASLWRFYRQYDTSTRVMFMGVTWPKETRDKVLLESGDARCVQWLWERLFPRTRFGDLVHTFCLAGARIGSLDMIQRYSKLIKHPPSLSIINQDVLEALCKNKWEQCALYILKTIPVDTSDRLFWFKLLVRITPYVHQAPNLFKTLYDKFAPSVETDMEKGVLYASCLLTCCRLGDLMDIRAFEWLWTRKSDEHCESWWINSFLDQTMDLLEAEGDSSRTSSMISRYPRIFKHFFSQHYNEKKEKDGTVVLKFKKSDTALRIGPSDENEQVLVELRMSRDGTVVSMAFSLPIHCL